MENLYLEFLLRGKNLPSNSVSSVITPLDPTIDSKTFKSLSVIEPYIPRLTGYLTLVSSTLVEYFATLERNVKIRKES